MTTGLVDRVFEGSHTGSVLSLCARGDYLATAGSDWLVCIWDLRDGTLIRTIRDHRDSVLCVRFDEKRLVSCSKGESIPAYGVMYAIMLSLDVQTEQFAHINSLIFNRT